MKITELDVRLKTQSDLTIALIADLHDQNGDGIIRILRGRQPDVIAIVGDLVDRSSLELRWAATYFLEQCASIAPTFYSLGNHERGLLDSEIRTIRQKGVAVLDNDWVQYKEYCFGGLSSDRRDNISDSDRQLFRENTLIRREMSYKRCREHRKTDPDFALMHTIGEPDVSWLDAFERQPGVRILLCHHVEYYPQYLMNRSIDLILSGHAHGGQIRLIGYGIYAPGQGFFPKYTSGIYDGKLIVSRGLANTLSFIPRLANPKELVFIHLSNAEQQAEKERENESQTIQVCPHAGR